MDTSKEYIEMCQKAEEIQRDWLKHGTGGDFAVPTKTISDYHGFWKLQANRVYIVGNDGEYDLDIVDQDDINETGAIWLPRQDQLQEIFEVAMQEKVAKGEISSGDVGHVIFHFIEWLDKPWGYMELAKTLNGWPSMEQLWLAFVMKEKHGKIWAGEEWKET
uniref:Uncharacterized protein n=1 Tax=viral metagenome TaxID=1070528 RepID=A0A6H1ZAR5_9ZZZZ